MEISQALTSLIEAGADAPANLYLISFYSTEGVEASDSSSLQIRTGNFFIPEVAVGTVDFPYQNDVYVRPVPSSNITKTGSFSLRVDQFFNCYTFLKSKVVINEAGNWKSAVEDRLIYKIKVDYVKPDLTVIKSWEFTDCYITSIGSFAFDYENASRPITTTVKFTWGNLDSSQHLYN